MLDDDDVNYTGSLFQHRCCNDLSSRRYGINLAPFLLPLSSRHFYQLARSSLQIASDRLVSSFHDGNGARYNLSRASHIFFRETKIETDEKPRMSHRFREHDNCKTLATSDECVPNFSPQQQLVVDEVLITRCRISRDFRPLHQRPLSCRTFTDS